jgi:succinoglycan biosynthesis transport protein ExoP
MELKEITAPLLKWWWLLVAAILVAAVSSFLAVQQQPPTYVAATTLMIGTTIEDPNPNGTNLWLSQQLAATYADIAYRLPVRQATMDALGLTWLPSYNAQPKANTQLMVIAVTDTDPLRAQVVANELAHQLIQQSPAGSQDQGRLDFINTQLDELQVKITETQDDITVKQEELGNMVSARQIADTQTQIAALQNKLTTLQSNYASLLSNTQEGAVNAIHIIEPAALPGSPVGPNKSMTVATSAAIGLVLAAGAAYLLEYLDNTIKGPEEVKKLTGIPTLAGIAKFEGERYRDKLITIKHPRAPVSEAYRSLRTGIQFSTIDKPDRATLLVTSPNPTEGKSVTVSNLAVVFAQADYKVLVIDADLRKPVQHRIFELSNSRGLTNFLLEYNLNQLDHALKDMAIQFTETKGLYVLTSGPIPPNPSEMLGSAKMRKALEELSKLFDYVILDSPPTMIVTDASVLSTLVDGVLLVTDADRTPKSHLKQAVERLTELNANLLGVVINRLSPKADGYYYHYYYYRRSYDRNTGYGLESSGASSNGKGPLGWLRKAVGGTTTHKHRKRKERTIEEE